MQKKVITITLWGDGITKGKWNEWYSDMKKFAVDLGYSVTHISILSESYTRGKVLTISRKEKEILSKIAAGETPSHLSCYVLPKDYKCAGFDYMCLLERDFDAISVLLSEDDYARINVSELISMLKQYIDFESGEIFETSRNEMPLVYVSSRDPHYLKTYKSIKHFK